MPLKLSTYPYTPGGKSSKPNCDTSIVLFHGWGCDSRIWQPLLPYFQQGSPVITVDIDYDHGDIDRVLAHIASQLPQPAILCGWSLGGMLATALAAQYPQQVSGLITLASNARFSASEDWPEAMDRQTFEGFCELFQRNSSAALKRFVALQTLGDPQASAQKPWLQQCCCPLDTDATPLQKKSLQQGLEWLATIDNTQAISTLRLPALYLFGENDALVPHSAAQAIEQHCGEQQSCRVLAQQGHLLHYPGTAILTELSPFLERLRDQP